MSKHRLDEAAVSALTKSLKYAIAPTVIPLENIISGGESALDKFDNNMAEEINENILKISRVSKPPKILSNEEHPTLTKNSTGEQSLM